MANEYGYFFDSVNGDRVYNSDSFAEWLRKFFTTGVFNGDLQVQPSSGMSITVGTGYANIEGRVRFFGTTQTKTLPVANGTYPRIDTIVVRLDLGNRQITCETVQGMYSGNNPSPTAPVREDGIYEIVLAQIYVGAGATEITTANITDTRSDDTLCGWVTSTVEGVPMSQIVAQMQAEFETWYDHMKDQLDEDAAGHLQLEIDSINSLITELRRIVDSHDGSMATVVSDTASEAFSTGAYVMKNNALRKVTSDISSGDTIDDTNTESTTIGAELTALNNGLLHKINGTLSGISMTSHQTLDNDITFDSPMKDTNYAVNAIISSGGAGWADIRVRIGGKTTTGVKIILYNDSSSTVSSIAIDWSVIY